MKIAGTVSRSNVYPAFSVICDVGSQIAKRSEDHVGTSIDKSTMLTSHIDSFVDWLANVESTWGVRAISLAHQEPLQLGTAERAERQGYIESECIYHQCTWKTGKAWAGILLTMMKKPKKITYTKKSPGWENLGFSSSKALEYLQTIQRSFRSVIQKCGHERRVTDETLYRTIYLGLVQ